jgi:hypothetical protein
MFVNEEDPRPDVKRRPDFLKSPKPVNRPNARDLIGQEIKEEDDKRKAKVEAAVRVTDGIAKRMRATQARLADQDLLDFDKVQEAMAALQKLKIEWKDRKAAIMFDLQRVDDRDFRELISFHFSRIGE